MLVDPTKPLSVEVLARAIDPVAWQVWDERQSGSKFYERGPAVPYERPWFVHDRDESMRKAEQMLAAYVTSVSTMLPPPSVAVGVGATQSQH